MKPAPGRDWVGWKRRPPQNPRKPICGLCGATHIRPETTCKDALGVGVPPGAEFPHPTEAIPDESPADKFLSPESEAL